MRLELSRQAEIDLADIQDYSVEQFELARAITYLDAIETAFRRIMDYPEIGGVQGRSSRLSGRSPATRIGFST